MGNSQWTLQGLVVLDDILDNEPPVRRTLLESATGRQRGVFICLDSEPPTINYPLSSTSIDKIQLQNNWEILYYFKDSN